MLSLQRQIHPLKQTLKRGVLGILARGLRKNRAPRSTPLQVHIGHHFWGMGNVGDDFMLAGFLQALGTQAAKLHLSCCTTGDLAQLSKRFPQVEWLPYTWQQRLAALSKAHLWLGLGDTPFQTDSGPWMEQHLDEERALCAGFGLPMHFLGVGVGQAEALGRPAFQRILQAAAGFWARDEMSHSLLTRTAASQVRLGADLANIFFHQALAHIPKTPSQAGMGLLLPFEKPGALTLAKLEACLDSGPAPPTSWLIQEQRDLPGSENATWNAMPPALRQRFRRLEPHWEAATVTDLLLSWRFPTDVASSRYHGALWAAWQGCRLIVITRSQKLEGLAQALQLPQACPQSDWSQPSLWTRTQPVAPERLAGLAETAQSAVHEWLHEALHAHHDRPQALRSFVYHLTLTTFKGWPIKSPRRRFRLTILKLDKIGDSVLALGAMRLLVSHFGEADTLFITSTLAAPLLRMEFPQASFEIMPAFCERYFPDFVLTLAKHASSLRAVSTRLLVCLRHQPSDYLHSMAHLVQADKVIATRWSGAQENTSLHFPRAELLPYADGAHDSLREEEESRLCSELKAHRRLLSHILERSVSVEEIQPSIHSALVSEGAHLLVCPTGGSALREYPPQKLAEVLRMVQENRPGLRVRLCLPPEANPQALQQAFKAREVTNIQWVFPPNIQTLLQEIATAGVVLALESAPAHLATAMDKAGVFLLGGGHYGLCAPWSRSQRQHWLSAPQPCYGCAWKCCQAEPLCITHISPAAIYQTLLHALPAEPGPAP